MRHLSLILAAALALTSCGGGGSDSPPAPAPVVISNLTFTPTSTNASLGTIAVSGSVQFSSGNDIASLRITDSNGANSTVAISAPGLRSGVVNIPSAAIPGNPPGLYRFTVWIRDSTGTDSNQLNGQIEIRRVPLQANAGSDQPAAIGGAATLNGSQSSNVNGTSTQYSWALQNAASTSIATLSETSSARAVLACVSQGIVDVVLTIADSVSTSTPDTTSVSCIPSTTFTLGSTESEVSRLAGTPTAVTSPITTTYEWRYSDGLTLVRFDASTRRVVGWRSYNIDLPTVMPFRTPPSTEARIRVGITKDDVARIQGTPREVDDNGRFLAYETWAYDKTGLTYIRFSKTTGLVIEFQNHDGTLRT